MRIERVEISGFLSWREPGTVDLTGTDLVAIVGPVRAGKSSIITAIQWALWGEGRGDVVTDVINDDSSTARVRVDLVCGAERYRITRTRNRTGRHEVLFWIADPSWDGDDDTPAGWRPLSSKFSADADARIIEVIGCDEQMASLTWLVRQNDHAAFFNLDAPRRRDVLARAFRLDRYDALAKAAEVARSAQAKEVDHAEWCHQSARMQLRSLVDELRTTAGHAPLPDDDDDDPVPNSGLVDECVERAEKAARATERAARALARIEDTDAAHAREQAEMLRTAHARDHDSWERECDAAAIVVSDAEADLSSARRALARAEEAQTESHAAAKRVAKAARSVDRLAAQADDALSRIAEAEADERDHRHRIERASESIADLRLRLDALGTSEGTCIVCESELTRARVRRLREQTEDAIAEATARLRRAEKATAEAVEAVRQANAERSRIVERLADARLAAEEASNEAARSSQEADVLDAATEAVEERHRRATRARTRLRQLEACEPTLDVATIQALEGRAAGDADVTSARVALEQARDAQRRADSDAAIARRAHEAALRAAEAVIDARDAADQARQRLVDITLVRDGFRPAGIPSAILASVVAELGAAANEVMSSTGDDGLTVSITSKRATSRGDATDKVVISARTATGRTRGWKSLSGSEQFRVSLAVRLGLSECIARRTGTPIRTVVVDEGWGNLDEASRRGVAAVLRSLAARGWRVITISHVDDVKESFPTLVHVDASTGTSRAEVVAN